MAKSGNNYKTYGRHNSPQHQERPAAGPAEPARESGSAPAGSGRAVKPLPEPRNDVDLWIREHGLSGTELKVIAMIFMLIDHIGHVFLPDTGLYWTARLAGRLAFPVFAFLVAEGCANSRNLYRYALRLLAFALISEAPYDYVMHGTFFYPDNQNVLFTFTAVVLAIALIETFDKKGKVMLGQTLSLLVVLGAAWLKTDYGIRGMAIVFIFYYFRQEPIVKFAVEAVLMAVFWWRTPQMFAMTALPLVFIYSGQRGRDLNKYLFYAFYPLHLIVIGLVRYMTGG